MQELNTLDFNPYSFITKQLQETDLKKLNVSLGQQANQVEQIMSMCTTEIMTQTKVILESSAETTNHMQTIKQTLQ